MDVALQQWFVREILAHEAALTRYLVRVCASHADVLDTRHDIYVKVIEAARKSRPLSPKSFLFTTARHLISDRIRRGRIVSIDLLGDLDVSDVLVDEISPEHSAGMRQQLTKLALVFDRLSDRCREVIWMKRIEGLSQKDIARRLKITEGTVELHLARGMKTLTRLFYGEKTAVGLAMGKTAGEAAPETEVDHGK